MVKSDLYDLIGEENVFSSMKESLARAEELLKSRRGPSLSPQVQVRAV